MFLKFFFTVVTMEIAVGITIYAFTGMYGHPTNVYPPWLWELFIGFYWFGYLFHAFNNKYFDLTKPESCVWELKPFVAWMFCVHWVSAYLLTYAVLPYFEFSFVYRILFAYFGSYLITFEIPIKIAIFWYPRHQKKLESEQISPERIRVMAEQCGEVREFISRLPKARFSAVDYAHKNQVAQCVFWHRKPRPECEGMFEDAVLSVPADIRSGKPLCDEITMERYIFKETDGRSAVLHLPYGNLIDCHIGDAPLDKDTLEKFGVLFDRFPSLRDAPFPLAVREPAEIKFAEQKGIS